MKHSHQMDNRLITPEMTILEIVDKYPQTESIIRKYDQQAGVCLCCQALFESLRDTAIKFGLNIEKLLDDLNQVIR